MPASREQLVAISDSGIKARRKICEAKRVAIECQQCGKIFMVPPSVAKNGRKTCSNECRYKYKRGPNGPNFGGGQGIAGEKNPNWVGGIENGRGHKHNKWKRLVLHRDNYECQGCLSTENLVAHHRIPYGLDKSLRYELSNGVTLCRKCHKWVHRTIQDLSEHIDLDLACPPMIKGTDRARRPMTIEEMLTYLGLPPEWMDVPGTMTQKYMAIANCAPMMSARAMADDWGITE